MLVKATDIIGAKVFTTDEGKRVEDVDDVIYNPLTNKVEALLVSPSGIFSEAKIILLKDARGVGKDAIIIQNVGFMKATSDIPQNLASIAERSDYLTENRIITETGVDLGKVVDILFDSRSGLVEEFEVSQGLKDVATGRKYVKVSDIITVGTDALIVRGYTERKIAEQAKKGGIVGGVTKAAKKARQESPKYLEQARVKAKEIVKEAQKKAREIEESPQAQQLLERARSEINYYKGRIQAMQTSKPKAAKPKKKSFKR